MSYTNPSISDFKTFFVRDFPFGTNIETSVLDADVGKAFTLANPQINPTFFYDQTSYTNGYMYLSAHYLVLSLRASSQGMNGQYNFLQQSKGVGSVNESFGIPERILKVAAFAMMAKTNYGAMYLQLILPQLVGQIGTVRGHTKP